MIRVAALSAGKGGKGHIELYDMMGSGFGIAIYARHAVLNGMLDYAVWGKQKILFIKKHLHSVNK